MRPRAVLFDFGGTLFSYREVQGQAFRPLLGEALQRLRVAAEPRAVGRAWKAASAETWRSFNPRPYYLHKDLFQDNFRRFAIELGAEPTADDLEWFHEAQRRLVHDGFALRTGCVAMLRALRAAGIHAGIVSNIDDDYLEPMLERAGLRSSLDAWTSSEAARSCKPHEAIFAHALAKAGASAAETVFVGDSPVHDVAGARRLGMRTILIRDGDEPAPGTAGFEAGVPDHEIRELLEILPLVGVPAGGA
jgi:putative hydrolase of the HAD superfamily